MAGRKVSTNLATNLSINVLSTNYKFGSDYPSMPYARILTEWKELGYKDEVMENIFHRNSERILGL
jgi:uncharacterized protein